MRAGDFWKLALNQYSQFKPYSADSLLAIKDFSDKMLGDGLAEPYGLGRTFAPVTKDVVESRITKTSLENACRFYFDNETAIERSVERFCRLVMKQERFIGWHNTITVNDRALFWRALGTDPNQKTRDSIQIRSRRLWFLGAYSHLVGRLDDIWLTCLLGEIEPILIHNQLAPISDRHYFLGPARSITETLDLLPVKYRPVESDFFWLALKRAKNAMQLMSQLGELELFRSMANRIFGTRGSLTAVLSPIEVLYLKSYVIHSFVIPGGDSTQLVIRTSDLLNETRVLGGESMNYYNRWPSIKAIIANMYFDLWTEIQGTIKRQFYSGSFECAECGKFMPRLTTGQRQKYCSVRCKKTSAVRRYRLKKKSH